ncbi:Ig-like domain-containing protein [uncultured Sphingomonas sp.]|uniref:Ig-like domain-containing protein n=1 Tax=Sphingomonas bacterium TaxID=1895847 RepID=UPI0035C99FE9
MANNDSTTMQTCSSVTVNVLANDTGTGIQLSSTSYSGNLGNAYAIDGQTIEFDSNAPNGTAVVQYTITDISGRTATATLSIQITGNTSCNLN